MSVRMIRAKIRDDKTADVEKAVKEVFAALEVAQPQGVHYASWKLADGVTYVILLGLDNDDDNALAAIPAFRDFQAGLGTWIAGPPAIEELTQIGAYGVF